MSKDYLINLKNTEKERLIQENNLEYSYFGVT